MFIEQRSAVEMRPSGGPDATLFRPVRSTVFFVPRRVGKNGNDSPGKSAHDGPNRPKSSSCRTVPLRSREATPETQTRKSMFRRQIFRRPNHRTNIFQRLGTREFLRWANTKRMEAAVEVRLFSTHIIRQLASNQHLFPSPADNHFPTSHRQHVLSSSSRHRRRCPGWQH